MANIGNRNRACRRSRFTSCTDNAAHDVLVSPQSHCPEKDDSESDKSSGGEDLSTLLNATKTRSANLLPNSQAQTHRVTSPPQAVTARNAATTCQSKPNGSFYSAPQQKRQRRAAAPAPAPEKKPRKEIKAKNPSKRGYK